MTPEEQRIAIAEACGWTPTPAGRWTQNPSGIPDAKHPAYYFVPDYLSNLNAMHEAEKVLIERFTDDYQWNYVDHLFAVCNHIPYAKGLCSRKTLRPLLHATAAQRAEAFLKTLGKWQDDK